MIGRQLFNFIWIGSIGFAVDSSVLVLLHTNLLVNIYIARIIAFTLATLTTWALNRRYTFSNASVLAPRSGIQEYLRYVSVQTGGGLINIGVFSACIFFDPQLRNTPILPLAAGSFFGLIWNFVGTKIWAFR